MIQFFALPLIATFGAAHLATAAHHRLRAEVAAKAAALALGALLFAAVPTLWLMGSSGLAHLGLRSPFTDWSEHLLPTMGPMGGVVGAAAFALMIVGAVRTVRVVRVHRRLRATRPRDLEVLPTQAVFAYTLPGPAGNIVVSEGLVAALSGDEYQAVIAHERAHARHRHDRYLLLGKMATALIPIAGSLADRLEFSLERWADDEAAGDVADRRLVARAIASVAAVGWHPLPSVAGVARLGAVARAESLLAPEPRGGFLDSVVVITGLALVAAMASAAFQLHHTAVLGAALLR